MRPLHNHMRPQCSLPQTVTAMNPLCKIRDIQRAVHQFELCLEEKHGVCLNEAMALCCLQQNGRLSSGELGEMLGLTPSNTSKVIASIERKDLISRIMGESDRRQMYFSLTDGGRSLLDAIQSCTPCVPEILRPILCE